jgi:hypothetical protein
MEKYELIKNEEKFFIDDYFIFELDDIELYRLLKLYETKLNEKEVSNIKQDFNNFLNDFKTNPFHNFAFPHMKINVLPYLENLFVKYNNFNSNVYFLILLLGNRKEINARTKQFYTDIITQNNFGITSTNIQTAITKEVKESKEFINFVKMLAEWYTRTELIIFYIALLNLFFMKNIIFVFDTKNYSPENNFNFSVSSFAKRNLLKLVSYICKKTYINTGFDYEKMALLVLSAVTCGITMNNVFNGVRSCAFVVIIYLTIGRLCLKLLTSHFGE